MLLLEPPVFDAFPRPPLRRRDSNLRAFLDYCRQYEARVLEIPYATQARILGHLTRGFAGEQMTPGRLHAIVARELGEQEYEYSGKAARLILLQAFVQSLSDEGLGLPSCTRQLLQRLARSIPVMLALAIDDHYGRLTGSWLLERSCLIT